MSAAVAKLERRAREYELIYILRPTVDNKEATKVMDRVTDVVKNLNGCMIQVDNWGRRKLAYPINKSGRGVFVYLRFAGFEDLILEIERNLGLLDSVIRFQTVLLNERVNLSDYQIDPEEIKLAELEDPNEDDEEASLAQRLGLVERPRAPRDDAPSAPRDGGDAAEGAEAAGEKSAGEAEEPADAAAEKPAVEDASEEEAKS